ncbi:hypothetical protein P152DRAFT_488002 [Eremomyces bilateralis CBS 781.70]|uniref:Uncharacterized protein n=1 Tax=Eremomyces bilateralis CBS 781.70 TaxID=1392243 RepID=A0A6G1G2P7_9PEZI|nr:uncharacterized protein P152DRAFT_488002 [Eremomyces bilateralis CBS 781.70]KAF1812387.1 hypothetical protein P152DRAFT_488002 [Eremomyces bilateralis CBS 781.70]
MNINSFPPEILSQILNHAVAYNLRDGVSFTFGLSQAPQPGRRARLERYVRGPNHLRAWDAASPLRHVCSLWHEWAVTNSVKDVYVRKRQGSERWAELSHNRAAYGSYELMDQSKLTGCYVYRDPFTPLQQTKGLFESHAMLASSVQRLWIHGFNGFENSTDVANIVRACSGLVAISLPWTLLRYLTASDWVRLLRHGSDNPLVSLEFLSVDLQEAQTNDPQNRANFRALQDSRVNFGSLKRLKLFGDSTFMPITDDDLFAISATASGLEEFHMTCTSSITINGVMSILKASQSTLRVLEHAPRSQDGFDHPHPGSLADGEHICEVLTSCPNLRDLSISVPTMCADLFSNENVRWKGECQVRAAHLCPEALSHAKRQLQQKPTKPRGKSSRDPSQLALASLLVQSRNLINACNRLRDHDPLSIEIFFSDYIFEPHARSVHGYFEPAETVSHGLWPQLKAPSGKGPYGSTGLYGKGEEGVYDRIDEEEFLKGLEGDWIRIND